MIKCFEEATVLFSKSFVFVIKNERPTLVLVGGRGCHFSSGLLLIFNILESFHLI